MPERVERHVIPVDPSLTVDEAWHELCLMGVRATVTGEPTWATVECDGTECQNIADERGPIAMTETDDICGPCADHNHAECLGGCACVKGRPMGGTVPIRRQPLRYEVVIDPTLDRRGRHQRAVHLPSGEVMPGVIRLRTWDEEVFLHECIHALCQAGELGLSEQDEEAVARQVSQGLYGMGWRYAEAAVSDREQP